MGLYLKSKKLDLEGGKDLYVVLNKIDAEKIGLQDGDTAFLGYRDTEMYVKIILTDEKVREGEIGLYEELVDERFAPVNRKVFLDIPKPTKSLEAIRKKMEGGKLTEDELITIMEDIGSRKLRETEVAFFVGTFFNPGFSEDEIYWMTKGMAQSGKQLDFKDIKGNGDMVVDKHSIGGTVGKGVTPILISILAANELVCPNTSTRAITSAAGTSDILEVVMPVSIKEKQVYEVVKKTGACLIWGGSLYLAPADDEIINVERSLRIQEFQKVLVSIVAKKLAMGVTHVLIDLPYGKNTKIERPDDLDFLSKEFKELFAKVGIKCFTIKRQIKGPEGNGVGPALEIREAIKILEQREDRSKSLEDTVVDMATILLEECGKAKKGQGENLARETLTSGKALDKFWEIAIAQGQKAPIKSEDIKVGDLTSEIVAHKSGKIMSINTRGMVDITRALGTPKIKEAGIYLNKHLGDVVEKGDVIATLYSVTESRLNLGKEVANVEENWDIV
ncbi:MAG: thymidine phosphorylase [candidate division WS6 bacterium 34_10]|uniref:Thymidine phosphorylase n=1 Tax=candidate division WS6 bacterium 34_10 TaxID=1641389 RepID=A0A101HHZ3_9BACT|nr:MAG: thymidine phosphorylase [candidate division WS6 bacterium 34_10]